MTIMKCNTGVKFRGYSFFLRYIIAMGWLSAGAFMASAVSNNQNYVRVTEAMSGSTNIPSSFGDISMVTVDYFDNLGRPMQKVLVGRGSDGNDIANRTSYDGRGNVAMESVMVPVNTSYGEFTNNIQTQCSNFYGDWNGSTVTSYEGSPDMRVTSVQGPGDDWARNGRKTTYEYDFNEGSGGFLSCVRYGVNADGKLVNEGEYRDGTLRITTTRDEDGLYTNIFTDKSGRKILMRETKCADQKDTYWVYNDIGQLKYMISPKGATALFTLGVCDEQVVKSLCYYYDYDSRNREIEKRIPGAGSIYYVYDKLNRVIFSQDGNQRTRNEWSVNKYDRKQRIAVEGVAVIPGVSRLQLQQQWGDSILIEKPEPEKNYEAYLFYSQKSGPSNFTAYKAYFYDDYSHWNKPLPSDPEYPQSSRDVSARGLLTGTAMLVHNDGNVITTATKYNEEGIPVLQCERDYGQTYTINTYIAVDFRGKPFKKKRVTSFVPEEPVPLSYTEQWTYAYDQAERLVKTMHKYQNNDWQLLCENTYDFAGRLKTNRFGSNNWQSEHRINRYSYNIRGWLTSQASPHFFQDIYYTKSINGSTPQYNGNISALSESSWYKTPSSSAPQYYMRNMQYRYDDYNQISKAIEKNPTDRCQRFQEEYQYDLNGNITYIERGETTNDGFDCIYIGYNGNQITDITDIGRQNLIGEVPQLASGTYNNACSYDANGNIIRDNSRGISSITYNPLNLPSLIKFDENNLIYNYYRADGVKYSSLNRTKYISTTIKVNANGDTIITQRVKANDRLRKYYGDLLKENGKVKRIYNEAGYLDIDDDAGTHRYNFYVRDYLGSVRAVVGPNGELWQYNDYHTTGIPSSQYGANADDHLHTGKEFNAFNGLFWYDNNARSQDPLLGRFTTPDPLAEKYPNFSPYAHCMNNSLKFVDVNGMDTVNVDRGGNIGTVQPGGEDLMVVEEPLPEITITATITSPQTDASDVMSSTLAMAAVLVVDDVTGVGVADDPAIPFIIAGGAIVTGGVWLYNNVITPYVNPPIIERHYYDEAHEAKKQGSGKSRKDRHEAQYNQGGNHRPVNPNKRKGADERREKGKIID